uniref:Uncharacterized protein n=1 Tax=Setaria italica TaxID=4555 RepID=K3ZZN1_SETIT
MVDAEEVAEVEIRGWRWHCKQRGGDTTMYGHGGRLTESEARNEETEARSSGGAWMRSRIGVAWGAARGSGVRTFEVVRIYSGKMRGTDGPTLWRALPNGNEIPLYMWNGKHWTIPSDKAMRQANLRQQSASGKCQSSPVDATSGDDEHSSDPESSTAKKSRKEPQQQELILDEGSQRASVSETDASLRALGKSLASDHWQTAPPVASNHPLVSCPPLPEKNGLSNLAHKIVSSMSKNRILCSSSGNSASPEVSVPDVIGEAEFSRDAQSVPSNGQLNTLVCGRNVDEACDMLSIPEVRKQNIGIASSLRNQQIQERPFIVKALSVKKGISKNRRGETHPKAHPGKNDASDHESRNSSGKEIICASSASLECQKTSTWTRQRYHDHISYLTEKDQLKARLLEKTTSLSQIDERLDKKEQTIAKLEEELGRARGEAHKIAEEKEREDEELSRLNAANSSVEEACAAELQFQSIDRNNLD